MGGGQIGRKGRLRAPSGGYRPHGHTTHQPDQDDHGEVATPALVKGGPEVKRRDSNRPSAHREASVGGRIPSLSVSSRAIRTLLHDY